MKRLSVGLKSYQLDEATLRDAALKVTAALVKKHCFAIAVDGTDISKPYGRSMPMLCGVHDGSKDEVAKGWAVLRADGVALTGGHVPLHIDTYSREDPAYRGEHPQLRSFLQTIVKHVPKTMPFVFDAGYDSRACRKIFSDLRLRHTTRLRIRSTGGLRRIVGPDSKKQVLEDAVDGTESVFSFRISKFRAKAKGNWVIGVGWRSAIRLLSPKGEPEAHPYSLVVIRYLKGEKPPLVLLTTDRIQTQLQARAVAERYFHRWATEDTHRLIKGRFRLENLRLLTWRGVKRMVFLVHCACAFMAWLVYRAHGDELAQKAQVVGKTPRFPFYRISLQLAVELAG